MIERRTGILPTPDELRKILQQPSTGIFNLHATVETGIPVSDQPEDSEVALRLRAQEVFTREIGNHPNFKTNRQKMRFIQRDVFGWDNDTLAGYLMISSDDVKKYERIGLKEKQLDKFREQFEGVFSIASILQRRIPDKIFRRDALLTPNGMLSELRVRDVIKAGKINLAVSITENALVESDSLHYIEEPHVDPPDDF